MSTDKIVCLLNWCVLEITPLRSFDLTSIGALCCRHATAYHLPLFLAQGLGYFADEGIKIAILEPK